MNLEKAKIALVFDWMTNPGGAERVNLVLHKMFPEAPIFTSIFNEEKMQDFKDAKITTSFINKLPFAKTKHQLYLSLMPYAYESFDLSQFDIVISSSHSCAKGIITKPETMHICYCHSPMRYAWDNWHSYIQEYKMNFILKKIGKRKIHKLRMWDRLSAERVDHFIANSNFTKKRIQKYYSKPSSVIYPMIDTEKFKNLDPRKAKQEKYFLAVGRLAPYKQFNLIVEAFNELNLPLKIVGTGILEKELIKTAKNNIEFLGFVEEEELKNLYHNCEALIFPQEEDFGITPLECMASGKPVIAYKAGGALETIVEGKTGIFFKKQNAKSLIKAVEKFQEKKGKFIPAKIKEHAKAFDTKIFENKLMEYLRNKWAIWEKNL